MLKTQTLLSHGNSFLHGVKFSVQTTSRGSVAYLKYAEAFSLSIGQSPIGLNVCRGDVDTLL